MSNLHTSVSVEAMPTKAMLLAAGKGTRLRPLTETIPKCMIPIAGKPLIEYTIEWLQQYGITNLMINVHYLPEVLMNYFEDGSRWGVSINYSQENQLMGTAGAVKKVEGFFQDAPFFVWYGDNLSRCRLDKLWELHRDHGVISTIALHHREDPTQSGIVGLDEKDRITRFLEKPRPELVFSHWVNAGILAFEPSVLEMIPSGVTFDFGLDVFPALLERGEALHGYRMAEQEGPWWIDTPEDLQRLQQMASPWTATAS